jgi:hypothetical protein
VGEAALGEVFIDGNTLAPHLDLRTRGKSTRWSIGDMSRGAVGCWLVGYRRRCGGGIASGGHGGRCGRVDLQRCRRGGT